MALSLAHSALRWWAHDALSTSVVWGSVHHRVLFSVPELVQANALDRCGQEVYARNQSVCHKLGSCGAERHGILQWWTKLYYWTIAVCAVIFLITGLLLWFDHVVARWLVAVSYLLHGLAALAMLAGFIIHLYEGTAAQPGTFQSMTNGTVTNKWAWTHHPAWYAEVTGRDPREDYERERRRLTERDRVVEDRERAEDRRRASVIAPDDNRER
jgi:cytochrome b subunit of formate dehydrogenase